MASILPVPSDCCLPCCPVSLVDLPSGGGTGSGVNVYDTVDLLRQETRVTVLVDDTPSVVYDRPNQGATNSGFYFYDSSSVLPDDGISVIQPNSVVGAGRWLKFLG